MSLGFLAWDRTGHIPSISGLIDGMVGNVGIRWCALLIPSMYVKKYFWLVVLNIDYVQPYFFGIMIQIDNNNIVGMG